MKEEKEFNIPSAVDINNSASSNKLIINTIPEPVLTFRIGEKDIGNLSWKDGIFKFKGQADNSAQIFFDFLKSYIEKYTKTTLTKGDI